MGLHPRGGGGGEEGLRVTSRGFQISAQGHGRYGSIANLGPFVAKDHPRIALGIDVEGAVQGTPRGWGQWSDGMFTVGSFGTIRNQHRSPSQLGCGVVKGGKQVVFTSIGVALWSPVVFRAPKTGEGAKNGVWALPRLEIPTGVEVESCGSGLLAGGGCAEEVVGLSGGVRQEVGIPNPNIGYSERVAPGWGALGLGLHAGDNGPNEPYDAECESYEFQDNGPFEQR